MLTTVDPDRGGFACMLSDEPELYVVGARWPGAAGLATHTDWDGYVWRVPAPAAGAGWPARSGPAQPVSSGHSGPSTDR